jgi:hypothetical protein
MALIPWRANRANCPISAQGLLSLWRCRHSDRGGGFMTEPVATITIRSAEGLPSAAAFGLGELCRALTARGYRLQDGPADVVLDVGCRLDRDAWGQSSSGPLGNIEAYSIAWQTPQVLRIVGSDVNGLLYGCLDLAEHLDLGGDLESVGDRRGEPNLAVRGVYRFLHNEEAERGWVNDARYWQAYADMLSRCRFNRFNLIYGHQSPYLIPIYAFMLDDLDDPFPDICVHGITADERARNLEALQLASEAMVRRGLTFFLGIWNSRPWKVRHGVWENQPTRVSGTDDLDRLVEYTRKGFTRLVERCPGIGGIQLRMNIESGVSDQRFFVKAFVPALKDLASVGRRLIVELRNWGLRPDTVEAFRSAGLPIVVSMKYFAEHQAMPYQPPVMPGSYSYDSFLRKDKPFPVQWHVWNLGSHRLFNWGDPDYARRFARSCHLGDGSGFEITPPGSQKGFSQWGQVSPGDWQARPGLTQRWDFERHWFFHLAFGRMAYDPSTSDAVFVHHLAKRTSAAAAPKMLAAYRAAGQVISYLISQRMDDRNMYVWPELDCGGPIDHNTLAPPGETTLVSTAREFAMQRCEGRGSAKLSPFDCARDLDALADEVDGRLLALVDQPDLSRSAEYQTARMDFAALAALARYHAAKSRATGSLALFYACGERCYLDAAQTDAEAGVALWDELCRRTDGYYRRLHYGPTGGHWADNRPRVSYDRRRVARVRELFDGHGLFRRGFDFGPRLDRTLSPRAQTGLETEPRFVAVDETTAYSPERGYGWLRPAGLQAYGIGPVGQELIWGVHRIRPGVDYDPGAIDGLPLDGLTQTYLAAREPRAFRVDLRDGEYEVTAIAPTVAGRRTSVHVGDVSLLVGGAAPVRAEAAVGVRGGSMVLDVGGCGPWALAGLVVRSALPQIAHLPAAALRAESDAAITATATAPDGVTGMVLRYCAGRAWQEVSMTGDGAAYRATVPACELTGETLRYSLVAEGPRGVCETRSFNVPIVRGFKAPRVVDLGAPKTWSPAEPWSCRLTLENGKFASELRLHYRGADQNALFQSAVLAGGRSGEFEFAVPTRYLDGAYELIYYIEIIDVLGGGSFHPDPFSEARYYACRPQ